MSFEDLFERLDKLSKVATIDDQLHIICYTPALGYLALPERNSKEWIKFLKESGEAKIITLDNTDLTEFHGNFLGRRTRSRIGEVTAERIAHCGTECDLIRRKMPDNYIQVRHHVLPGWYCFFTRRRAIVVTPLYLPISDKSSGFEKDDLPPPAMIGYETSDLAVIEKLEIQFQYIEKFKDESLGESTGASKQNG